MKNIVFVLSVFLIFLFGCSQPPANTPIEPLPQIEQAEFVLGLSGGPASEDYESMKVKISEVQVQKENGEWIDVSRTSQEFDLFELGTQKARLAAKILDYGLYKAVRFKVDELVVVEIEEDELEDYEVIVPSEQIVITSDFKIEGTRVDRVIDFDPYSVVVENDEYILRPNIKLLTLPEFEQKVQDITDMLLEQEEESAKPKITEIIFPSSAQSGETIEVRWKVISSEDKEVSHTAIHWDLISAAGQDHDAYANTSDIQMGMTNQEFSVEILLPEVEDETTVYFKVHATTEEEVESPEMSLTVTPQSPVEVVVREYSVSSDDQKFEPNMITAKAGEKVIITFSVPTSHVSFGGERISASNGLFDFSRVPVGESQVAEFIMPNESFTVRSYWPSTSIFKASMQVKIEE